MLFPGGRIPPLSPQTDLLPISADDTHLPSPLCASPRGDSAGSFTVSTPSPVPSLVIHYGVIRLVCRDSIVFVVVVVALEISTLRTSYHQFSPPFKNWLRQLLRLTHLNKLTKPVCHEMHPGARTEVQKGPFLNLILLTTSCHRSQNDGPGSKLQEKTNICLPYVCFRHRFSKP